jgi:hypothetical protein
MTLYFVQKVAKHGAKALAAAVAVMAIATLILFMFKACICNCNGVNWICHPHLLSYHILT